MRKRTLDQIITSLLDQDLYKLTMMQLALFKYPAAIVEHEFKCRNVDVDLRPYRAEIEEQIKTLEHVTFQPTELDYLSKRLDFIKPEFIPFLKMFRFDVNQIKVQIEDNQLTIKTCGPWWQTILYEIFVLAIVNEVYFSHKLDDFSQYEIAKVEEEGRKRLRSKLDLIKNVDGFQFVEFGTRRRFSKEWQRKVLDEMTNYETKDKLIGTSNILLAKDFDLVPIGTMAHEFFQAYQGFDVCPLSETQDYALSDWSSFYGGRLGIALTDIVNMNSFLKSFGLKNAKLFDGLRHDSGDPIVWGEKAIAHYNKLGIDPMTKSLVFSDGLNFEKSLDIFKHFDGRIKTSYGIGTNITNDVGFKALNIVMKMTMCNGKPVAKISDEPGKSMCKDPEFLSYLLKVHDAKPDVFSKPLYTANVYN